MSFIPLRDRADTIVALNVSDHVRIGMLMIIESLPKGVNKAAWGAMYSPNPRKIVTPATLFAPLGHFGCGHTVIVVFVTERWFDNTKWTGFERLY